MCMQGQHAVLTLNEEFSNNDKEDSNSNHPPYDSVNNSYLDHPTLSVYCLERAASNRREKYYYHLGGGGGRVEGSGLGLKAARDPGHEHPLDVESPREAGPAHRTVGPLYMSDESDDEGPVAVPEASDACLLGDDAHGKAGQSHWQAQFASTASLTSLAMLHPQDRENDGGFDADVRKRMLSEHTLSRDVFPQTMQPDKWLWISSRCDTLPGGLSVWKAFVKRDTLFVDATCFDQLSDEEFRTTLLALLELAEDVLRCASIVMCAPRSNPQSSDLVRAFMYAGFELVHPGTYRHSPNYLLVGYEV